MPAKLEEIVVHLYRGHSEHLLPDLEDRRFQRDRINGQCARVPVAVEALVYLVGDLARGNDSTDIDLWFVGDEIDEKYLEGLTKKAAQFLKRKLNYLIMGTGELEAHIEEKDSNELLLVWKA